MSVLHFFFWSDSPPLWANALVHSSFNAPLGYFHFVAINNAAVNIGLVVWTSVFLCHQILSFKLIGVIFTISHPFLFTHSTLSVFLVSLPLA